MNDTKKTASAYNDPGCAYCQPEVRVCREGEGDDRRPGFCPSKIMPEECEAALARYDDPELQRIAQVSARVEAEGYCRWTRVEETVQFAKKMGFTRIGIAMCISFIDLARILSQVLESHGFEVVSVCCKHGGIAKEELGLEDKEKVRPGGHESICNPVSQAHLLNERDCELNIVMGLCVGHDSLFYRHSKGLVTTLVAKDRVLAHNPVGALQLADSYFSRIWGPDRPQKPSKRPRKSKKG